MEKLKIGICPAVMFMLISLAPVQALNLELQGGWGNFAFDKESETPLGIIRDETGDPIRDERGRLQYDVFSPGNFYFYRFAFSGESGHNIHYSMGYEQDPILRNRLFLNAGVRLDNFVFEAGPFFGMSYDSQDTKYFLTVSPGLYFSARVESPGFIFANAKFLSSLGSVLENPGDYSQKSSLLQLGFWAPNIIATLNYETQSFYMQQTNLLATEDILDRYFFRAEIHIKNKPLTLTFNAGYQLLGRAYSGLMLETLDEDGDPVENPSILKTSEANELDSIFLGLQGEFNVGSGLKFFVGGEMPFRLTSTGDMKAPGPEKIFFTLHAGMIWTLPSFGY